MVRWDDPALGGLGAFENLRINYMNKKSFLILTENLGKTAPGIVFERLIREIAARHDVVVVCINDYTSGGAGANSQYRGGGNLVGGILSPSTKARLSKLSLAIVGDDWSAWLNAITLANVFKHNIAPEKSFDYIFSLVSFRHTSPLLFAEKLIRRGVAKKSIAYFVDAIPAPLGWSVDNCEFRGLQKFAARRMQRLDALFSSNAQMLKYQLSLMKSGVDLPGGVLLNPITGQRNIFPPVSTDKYNFLYTGGVYGKRTIKYILGALKKVLKVNQNVYLVFVGSNIKDIDLSVLNDFEKAHVVIEAFSSNLDHYYQDAVALVDIDADMDNDVFLSSKVTNYLPVNRLILSETGANSPASKLFSGIDSIIQCSHDSDLLAGCMINAIEKSKTATFDDRQNLIEAFSVGAVVNQMEALLDLGGV